MSSRSAWVARDGLSKELSRGHNDGAQDQKSSRYFTEHNERPTLEQELVKIKFRSQKNLKIFATVF